MRVAGAVITRQRPGTAKGFCFITLEDEEGVANLILAPRIFQAHRNIAIGEPFLLAEGILQIADGTVAVKVESLQALRIAAPSMQSHDFH